MIRGVSLANFLAFETLNLPMSPLTVLTGTNSAGKSSLLHALALLHQSDEARVLASGLMLNGELVELGTGIDVLHAEPRSLSGVEGVGILIELELSDRPALSVTATYSRDADVLALASSAGIDGDAPVFAGGFQYLRADRIVPAVTYPKSHEAVAVRGWLGARGEHAANYLRVHGAAPSRCVEARHDSAVGPSLLDQVNAWLNVLSLGTSVSAADVEGTDYVRLSFTRTGPEVKTLPHRSTNVGFGLTYALPVIVACLDARASSVIVVENPEAHLHPSAQAALGNLCARAASGGAQLIIETHSDHVLNAVRLAVRNGVVAASDVAIHFFTRRDRVLQPEVQTLQVGSDGMLPSWPSGFFDEWDRAVDELLS